MWSYRWFVRVSCSYILILVSLELLLHLFLAEEYKLSLFLINIPAISFAYTVNTGSESDRKWLCGIVLYKALFKVYIMWLVFKEMPDTSDGTVVDIVSILFNAVLISNLPIFIAGLLCVVLLITGKQYRNCFLHEYLGNISNDDEN